MLAFRHFAFRLVLTTMFACAAPAFAQSPFTLTLDNPNAIIVQGSSVVFTGTIVNTSGQDQPTVSYASQGLVVLPDKFSNSLPYSFSANYYTASYHGPLFTVSALSTTPAGYYGYPTALLSFSIGQYVPATGKTINYTTVPYTVTVLAAAPEPSPFVAFAVGLLSLGALAVKAKRRTA